MTIVDRSAPASIAAAIKKVSQTPGLRVKPGAEALWKLYSAPGHALARAALARELEVDLHFGWFCRRVAEELGSLNPNALALVDRSEGEDGAQVLTLKPAVVAALDGFKKVKNR